MNLFPEFIAYHNTDEVEREWIPGPVDDNVIADNEGTVDEGVAYSDTYELEEGEWIPDSEDENGIADRSPIDEGIAIAWLYASHASESKNIYCFSLIRNSSCRVTNEHLIL